MEEIEILVSGIVQGVGFRPFCARIAEELDITGTVRNTPNGVELNLSGSHKNIEIFLDKLTNNHPPLAVIHEINIISRNISSCKPQMHGLTILESSVVGEQRLMIPSDVAMCPSCREDIESSQNKRFEYPFTNCTDCGPRYTIINNLPYDRKNTTMQDFVMCAECAAEYTDIRNRRYHAQPNACPKCGPHIWIEDREGNTISLHVDVLTLAAEMLKQGKILAIKGLGGFHLAVDSENPSSVKELRIRKNRPHKPFALMCRNIDEARRLAFISEQEEKLLTSHQAPIVLLKAKIKLHEVAPGIDYIGIMLPYTPLHLLLLKKISPLVMTSGNLSSEPIVHTIKDAHERLNEIADIFLTHNRPILASIDDSVVYTRRDKACIVRRARGFAPTPIRLPCKPEKMLLGVGAEEKSTFCITIDEMALPSPYLGDLKYWHTLSHYKKTLDNYSRIFSQKPEIVAHDLHPQYLSTEIAKSLKLPIHSIQHHHAHLAACMSENGFFEKDALGLILDGTGLGEDNSVWGGELLIGNPRKSKRIGHLKQWRILGGDKAIENPWMSSLSILYHAIGDEFKNVAKELFADIPKFTLEMYIQQTQKLQGVPTSSCGRLFDAAASIITGRLVATYDAQAPMELESLALSAIHENVQPFYPDQLMIKKNGSLYELDWTNTFCSIVKAVMTKVDPRSIALGFHKRLAEGIAEMIFAASIETGIKDIFGSGGVFFNRVFIDELERALTDMGLSLHEHKNLSPGDECISYGQVAAMALLLSKGDQGES